MFKFTKSETSDLGKLAEPIQYKVLCDWLRNISNQNIQLKRQITLLKQSVDSILENEGHAEMEAREYADSSEDRTVS